MRQKYKSHADAIKYLRNEHFGRTLSYREVAEVLSEECGETIPKSEPWNAEHRKYRCPKRVKDALISMGLLESGRRYRFFYEVGKEDYRRIKQWLENNDLTFTEWMRNQEAPWEV